MHQLTPRLFFKIFFILLFSKDAIFDQNVGKYICYISISDKCWTFYTILYPEKMFHGFHKNMKLFINIDNKKKFLSTKSTYQNDFWRIMWPWRLE